MRNTVLKLFHALLIGLLPILVPWSVHGAGDVVVRLSATPDAPWLGQKVVLMLDVLSSDGWAQLKKVDDHEIGGGYVKRFETQGTRLQETLNGENYSGQRYEYLFFPQRAGERVIEPMAIDVETKSWGAQAITEITRQSTPPITLHVKLPPDIEPTETLISTPDFSATQKWQPQATDLSAGDAVVRTVALEGADISGMVITPLKQEELPGVGVYLSNPQVDDRYNRGDLTGRRVETITYVMEHPGDYQAADLVFTWWNTQTEKLETTMLSGLSFHVQAAQPGSESSAPPADVPAQAMHTAVLFFIICVAVLLTLLGLLLKNPIGRWYLGWKKSRDTSEKNYFKKVTQAAKKNDRLELLNAALRWLDRISEDDSVPRLDLFLSRYGNPDDVKVLTEFCSGLDTTKQESHSGTFYSVLVRARSQWQQNRRSRLKAEQLLPAIGLD